MDVLRDDLVVAEGLRHGTKEDLVEGRGGDGSVVHGQGWPRAAPATGRKVQQVSVQLSLRGARRL